MLERPEACTSLWKVQYRILPPLRGLIYQYCNTALHKKHKQISRQMSSKYDYFVCKNKKPSIDWVKFELDKAKYLLSGIYGIIWCSWVWNFEDNSVSFYLLLCNGKILVCQQGVFNVYQHFVCLPEITVERWGKIRERDILSHD